MLKIGHLLAVPAVLFALLAPAVSRAGSVQERDGKTVITVTLHDWVFDELDPSQTGTSQQANYAATKEFMRQFPEIFAAKYRARYQADPATYGRHNWDRVEVRLEKFSGIKVEGVEPDLLAIAGRVAPDIIYLHFRKSDTYIQQGFLYPLDRPEDGYAADMTAAELDFRVNEKLWPVIKRKGPGGQKHLWALPHGGAMGKVLFYRKDLFDEAGLAYPDEKWTWDDLYEACRKLRDPDKDIYGIALANVKDESYYWVTFLWSAGSEILVYHEDEDRWEIAFANAQGAMALDYYSRLCSEPWTDAGGHRRYGYAYRDPNPFVRYDKWQTGSIAMSLGTLDENVFARSIDPDIVGIAPVPISYAGIRAGELNSRMMGLFSEIEDRAVRDAAWEFIRFYDSRDAVEIKTRKLVEGGLGRFVNPRLLRLFGYQELIRLAPPGWEDVYNIAIASSRPEPYGRHSNNIYNLLDEPVKKANELRVAGKLPEDEAARRAVFLEMLERTAVRAREEILGEVPAPEMKKRRLTAGLFLAALVGVFVLAFRVIIRTFTPPAITGEKKKGWELGTKGWAYVLLVPAVLTILLWQYFPLLRGSIMAFQDYRVMGDSTFVGLDNFGNVFWDREWWTSVWNALRYSFLIMVMTFLPPVGLAILLQEVPHGKIMFRTLFYLPAVITSLVVILLWKSFYNPTEFGALNAVMLRIPAAAFLLAGAALAGLCGKFYQRLMLHGSRFGAGLFAAAGILLFAACYGLAAPALHQAGMPWYRALFSAAPEPYRWLEDSATAMVACVLPMVWAGVGPGCLIYLAALKGIPDDLYEAADMDGATFIDKILFVVFPMLKPLLIINFVGVFIGAWFHSEANILAMTGGQSGTEVAGLHIFYKAFMYLRFGPATAMAWMLGFMLILFTMYQLRILSRLEFRTTGEKE